MSPSRTTMQSYCAISPKAPDHHHTIIAQERRSSRSTRTTSPDLAHFAATRLPLRSVALSCVCAVLSFIHESPVNTLDRRARVRRASLHSSVCRPFALEFVCLVLLLVDSSHVLDTQLSESVRVLARCTRAIKKRGTPVDVLQGPQHEIRSHLGGRGRARRRRAGDTVAARPRASATANVGAPEQPRE